MDRGHAGVQKYPSRSTGMADACCVTSSDIANPRTTVSLRSMSLSFLNVLTCVAPERLQG